MTQISAFNQLSLRERAGWLLLALLLSLVVLGQMQMAALRGEYPPIGQMVDVGGYRLHLYCQGEGTPTVVLDAGAGLGSGLAFAHLQPEVARTTRVCSYDRAGQGWSEASPRPRTSQVIVDELHTLLHRADVPGPYVLAGYSFGGLNVRLYAYQYPDEVAGMILIDGSHEDQSTALGTRIDRRILALLRILPLVVRSGLPALVPSRIPIADGGLPVSAREAYQALVVSDPKAAEAGIGEMLVIEESGAQVHAARAALAHERPLGEIPLIVLVSGRAESIPGVTLSATEQQRIWRELQEDLARQSSRGALRDVPESGHDLLDERPDRVIESIVEVVYAVRR